MTIVWKITTSAPVPSDGPAPEAVTHSSDIPFGWLIFAFFYLLQAPSHTKLKGTQLSGEIRTKASKQ